MDSKSIENFPDEILENIFHNLDLESLKSSSLVSKRWNKVISGSPKFLQLTKIKLKYFNVGDNYNYKITRQYQHMEIIMSEKFYRKWFSEGEIKNPFEAISQLKLKLKTCRLECLCELAKSEIDLLKNFLHNMGPNQPFIEIEKFNKNKEKVVLELSF